LPLLSAAARPQEKPRAPATQAQPPPEPPAPAATPVVQKLPDEAARLAKEKKPAEALATLARAVKLAKDSVDAAGLGEAEAAACGRQLMLLHNALEAYERDRKQPPDRLSDLVPKYLPDKSLLHCPADPTPGTPLIQGAPADPG